VLKTANAECDVTIERYLAALEQAEAEARQLINTRSQAVAFAARLADLTRNWGLDRPVGSATGLSPLDAKRAYLVGLLLSEAAYGEPSDVVTRDLAAARGDRWEDE